MKSFALIVGAAALKVSPVQKVIQLIDELKAKVQKDLDAEAKAMEDYSNFCDDEQTQKGFAIKTASRAIAGYKAAIVEAQGQIQTLSAEIDSAGTNVASKTEELRAATEVRNNENSDYKAAEKELVDAVDTLGRATVIIKREMSFMQGKSSSALNKKLGQLAASLGAIIDASWIDSSSRQALKSFMETDEDLTLNQPQASVKNYESKSGGIVATLEDMKDKAEGQLQNLRREETKARHAFELLKQSLTDAVTNLNKAIAEATANKSGAGERLAQAQGDLATTAASKAADEEYVAKLASECESKANEWSERQKTAKDEMAALAKGHEILTAKFGFAQIRVHKTTVRSDSLDARDRVTSLLKRLGRTYNSFALMQVANAATKDPFVKIRGMVEQMIGKLEKQAQEEATQEAFCQEETKKSQAARDNKSAKADKYRARIDQGKAAIAELKNEISELQKEIGDINKSNRDATALRKEENEAYVAASTDFKESAEACTQALVVLKDFYRGDSFIQQPEFGGARSDAGHSIIEILEVAQEDFSRLLAESEADESEAVAAYKKLSQENAVAKATKEAAVKAKTSEVKSVEVAVGHHNEDLETVSKELDAVMEYLAKLKPQCESKAMSYEERKARRDAEIGGLKEALTILTGDDVGAFIQKKGFMQQ